MPDEKDRKSSLRENWSPDFTLLMVICLSLLMAAAPALARAQEFEFGPGRYQQKINFLQVKNLVIVPVYINGKGPYNFLLDTGVAQMIITDTTFLQTLQLKDGKTVKVQGYGIGADIEAVTTRELEVSIGKAKISHMPVAIFKKDIFDLSGYLGMQIHGLLGYYFFKSFRVTVNYASNRLTFSLPGAPVKIKGKAIPLQLINFKPYVQAIVKYGSVSYPLTMLLDNGSSHAMLLEALHGVSFPLPARTIMANLGVGINGAITGHMGRADTLSMAGFSFSQVLSGYPDFNSRRMDTEAASRNGSIGAGILSRFLVTIDYPHGQLYLDPSARYHQPFEHDMSGLEIYRIQDKIIRFFIGRVEPGSAGALAGLQAADEITGVNLKEAGNYSLDELTGMLKSAEGRRLLLEIHRGNEYRMLLLTLQKRI